MIRRCALSLLMAAPLLHADLARAQATDAARPAKQKPAHVAKQNPAPVARQIDDLFTEYCAGPAPQELKWSCKPRVDSTALKWDILNGYCKNGQNPHIATFCPKVHATPSPLTLTFDHLKRQWDDPTSIATTFGRRVSTDRLTGIPTIELKPGDPLSIVIANTNPLLVSATRGAVTETDIEQVQALQKLLGLVGGAVSVAGRDIGVYVAKKKQIEEYLDVLRTQQSRFSTVPTESDRLRVAITQNQIQLTAMADAERLDSLWQSDSDQIVTAITALSNARQPLVNDLETLTTHRQRLQRLAQDLEAGQTEFSGALTPISTSLSQWSTQFQKLDAHFKAGATFGGCGDVYAAFLPLLTTNPDPPVSLHAAILRFFSTYNRWAPADQPPPPSGTAAPQDQREAKCALRNYLPELKAAADNLSASLNDTVRLTALQTAHRDLHLQNVETLAALLDTLTKRRAAVEEALQKEDATRKVVASLGPVITRVQRATLGATADGRGILVENRLYLNDNVYNGRLTKIATVPVNLTIESPFADQVVSQRPKETATSYKLARAGGDRFSVGVGMIAYTPVYESTYSAADPDPTKNKSVQESTSDTSEGSNTTTTTTITTPELKSIIEKDRDSRTGTLAMFANYRLGSDRFRWGGQFGVGLSTDKPALLVGGSVSLLKWLDLGAGCGFFRVKSLGPGLNGTTQEVDVTKVTGDADIVTRPSWSTCSAPWKPNYVTISVNLLGIPLFQAK